MKLTLKPIDIPFMVGDTVWVDQPFGSLNQFPFFQGTIMQIILDGNLMSTLVVRQRKESHELIVENAMYSLKPVGEHDGSPRVNVTIPFYPFQKKLFVTREELMTYQDQLDA